jgi:hypothetical protein
VEHISFDQNKSNLKKKITNKKKKMITHSSTRSKRLKEEKNVVHTFLKETHNICKIIHIYVIANLNSEIC